MWYTHILALLSSLSPLDTFKMHPLPHAWGWGSGQLGFDIGTGGGR